MAYVSSLIDIIEKRQQVDAIYVDFSKAFDRVPHNLAVEKLKRMGFPDWITKWLYSYLTDRTAFVRVNGARSSIFKISSGVPQGSHLGPLLFVLFVNDLCTTLTSSKLMYADDLKFFRAIKSIVDSCVLQNDIDKLLTWCTINGMEANISKCNVISFCRLRSTTEFDYQMSGISLNRVALIKDLGVLFDSKLKFSDHIAMTTAKAFAVMGFIRRNTQFFEDVYTLKTLYCSLVRSILEYCVQVWAPFHQVQIDRLERVQSCFLRYALRLLPWNVPTRLPRYEHCCQLLSLPSLDNRRILLQRLFVFDILQNNIDCADLLGKLQLNAPARRTRQIDFLRPRRHRTQYGQHNPIDVCARRFNEVYDFYNFDMSKLAFKLRIS